MANPILGKYGPEAEELLKRTGAKAVLVMIVGGDRGSGFTVAETTGGAFTKDAPRILRLIADDLEAQRKPLIVL